MKRFQWKIGQAKHQVSSLEFWDGNEAFFLSVSALCYLLMYFEVSFSGI